MDTTEAVETIRLHNQKNVIDGIPIDPVLRDEFDLTDNDERPQWELDDWWGKPYITTDTWEEETYEEYFARSKEFQFVAKSKQEFDERMKNSKKSWFDEYPSGVRYNVRCLDGGAWDRSSNKGFFPTIDEAVRHAKSIKNSTLYMQFEHMRSN